MKTLKNYTLIYDNECPMCNIYSKGFIKIGMLEQNGRQAFTEISAENKKVIDFDRAKNEIVLVDRNKNEVIYGLDSLLLIIGNSFPLLAEIARARPLHWFFKKLYSFVSYNRKQIIPSGKDYTEQPCVPDILADCIFKSIPKRENLGLSGKYDDRFFNWDLAYSSGFIHKL